MIPNVHDATVMGSLRPSCISHNFADGSSITVHYGVPYRILELYPHGSKSVHYGVPS
jgi:hypothetical protein